MSQIASTSAAANSATSSNTLVGNSIEDLDLDVFLDLMLTQLQSQDPLNPMDNQEMLNTISQIREISANDKLSETLDSVLLGQNVSTASGMIGREVEGLTDTGRKVTGTVQQVVINDGQPELELAIEATAEAGKLDGSVGKGKYAYEVVWETKDGAFGIGVDADTAALGDAFKGSVRIDHLPSATVKRTVYRSDATGRGEKQFVGVIPAGATSFTDQLADRERGAGKPPKDRNLLRYADSVSVKLSNISTVTGS